ncbi:hypothetical protein Aspvir_009641 [Aspergillus viridinutans]|uniref:Jacalin-type lectin domain-containing protein n=1 Tax=Aspergillus viridinutans TaxID=75553 RepID=A0A9P3BZV7_ASPVI|nr:uncharacterized protein Aspvir_009641 [Aspergillus viridinutans]GIK05528.1 hypothetical protein Aspvir_009641 [Aspergillus viridinutans]
MAAIQDSPPEYGGGGGVPFSDYPSAASTLKKIEVWTGYENQGPSYVIKGIRLTWFDGEGPREIHGMEGKEPDKLKYTFAKDEKVKLMTIRAGSRVDSIYFETDKDGTFSAGAEGGTEYKDIGRGSIVGFRGAAAADLDRLGVAFR